MAYTLTDIKTIITNAQCCAAVKADQIVQAAQIGKSVTCASTILNLLWLYIDTLGHYDPADGDDNWITEAEMESMIQRILEMCNCFASLGPIDEDTNYLLQENGFNILQENGSGIFWA